ncbi:hypothetical protein C8P68_101624 [Mucilaginibacter yixingensis]|uniref:Tetratricopeptide repeat protein n=2 Tax=Mucilaginibacter yixingensis TaxID=1295612 RepID=A0A2T5JG31_9SPHI|nr:hypothetical protein C8P68_101624 [Mucilaginibacter yixingensis]
MRRRWALSLIVFSVSVTCAAGIVWACADYENDDASSFAPEYFVNKHYSPFFYDSFNRYYYGADSSQIIDNNSRYNQLIAGEWRTFLGQQLSPAQVDFLLFHSKKQQADSLEKIVLNKLDGRGKTFFNYLPLMKDCEYYSISEGDGWYEKVPRKIPPANVEKRITTALSGFRDPFIRERLWFQLVRYHYFQDTTGRKAIVSFNKYEKEFQHNFLYYRTLGYLAGAEYAEKDYAHANYHYSLCYNYTWQMYLPSQWSFHPQEEADWRQTLKLAKTNEEKITLWHLLGLENDPVRAIRMIARIDPHSEKLDLLLARLINTEEAGTPQTDGTITPHPPLSKNATVGLIDSIANLKTVSKPYYWHLAAGYMHYMYADYKAAQHYYALAGKEIPAGNNELAAQCKLLNILLSVSTLPHLDKQTETKLIEPLNWLADLRDSKKQVANLRFTTALQFVTDTISKIYLRQGERVKAETFKTAPHIYVDSMATDSLEKLLEKPAKTPFERAMLRYYPVKARQLYYQQALLATYDENINAALRFMNKADSLKNSDLPANPFNSSIGDCHECEFGLTKPAVTPLKFLQAIQALKQNIATGKDVYRSALQLGNAYYNITHYGNSRLYFQTDLTGSPSQPGDYDSDYKAIFTSPNIAQKYYEVALKKAPDNEARAKCAYLLSKCERNDFYNNHANPSAYEYYDSIPPAGQWVKELKSKYATTAYYKEVLKECGYFRTYDGKR